MTAEELHREAIVIDGHNDVLARIALEGYDLGAPAEGYYHTDIARLQAGGVTGQFFAIFIPQDVAHPMQRARDRIALFHATVARHPELVKATTADDVVTAKREDNIAALIGVEGGHIIENSLDNLRELYAAGARYMTLTFNQPNDWADSSTAAPIHNGLTDFGRDVVREMNRLGMMIDVSHCSDKTALDAAQTSGAPMIASHSCSRALCDHPRNLSDELISAIASWEGVVMVNFHKPFLDPAYLSHMRAVDGCEPLKAIAKRFPGDPKRQREERTRIYLQNAPITPVHTVVDHIEHVANVGGIDHVGLGSDFDGSFPADGVSDVASLPKITAELLRRGFGAEDVRKVLGLNTLRVMRSVGLGT